MRDEKEEGQKTVQNIQDKHPLPKVASSIPWNDQRPRREDRPQG